MVEYQKIWNHQSHHLLALRTFNTCNKYGSRIRWARQRVLRWYNKKDDVQTLEAMQKMIAFYDDKDIDMMNFGSTLQNLACICL